MFTLQVEQGLELALVEANFAACYLDIVSKQRVFKPMVILPIHAKQAFFLNYQAFLKLC